jgi:predicted esterase
MFRKFTSLFNQFTEVKPDSTNATHVLQPTEEHTHTVILLHGRDSCGREFMDEFLETTDSDDQTIDDALPNIKWVFPTAPLLHSRRFETEINQWFDMWFIDDPHYGEADQEPTPAIDAIHQLLAREARLVPGGFRNVILGGISQGSALAIHALLKQPHTLGGFIGVSSWLPRPACVRDVRDRYPDALRTPVLLEHARDDPVVAFKYGEEMRDRLEELGMRVEWRGFEEGAHWINEPDGVDHIVRFLRVLVGKEEKGWMPEGDRVGAFLDKKQYTVNTAILA